jgi:hypothetical protein
VVAELAAPPDPALEELLGEDVVVRLGAELAARARRWAAAVAPDRAFEATTLGAAEAAVHGHDGPLLLAAPDVPGLDLAVARAALEDFEAGCEVVVGAAHDARPYLVGLRHAVPDLIAAAGDTFAGGMIAAFAERAMPFGMLRSERRLRSPGDARALALDPLAPPELVAIMGLPGPGAR